MLLFLPMVYIVVVVVIVNAVHPQVYAAVPASPMVPIPLPPQLLGPASALTLAFAPSWSREVSNLAYAIVNQSTCGICTFAGAKVVLLPNLTEPVSGVYAGVEFTNLLPNGSLPRSSKSIDMTIRFNASVAPPTYSLTTTPLACREYLACPSVDYVKSGFLDLESDLASAIAMQMLPPNASRMHIDHTCSFHLLVLFCIGWSCTI